MPFRAHEEADLLSNKDACIVWFRRDLRLADNPALHHAAARELPVIPVYLWSPEEEAPWGPGAASRWWLHQSLRELDGTLRDRGARLVIREGDSLAALRSIIAETDAKLVCWNHCHSPAEMARDNAVRQALEKDGIEVVTGESSLLVDPDRLTTKQGGPFRVFTPFWRAMQALPAPDAPLPAPEVIPAPEHWPDSLPLKALNLEPTIDWAGGLREAWRPGEAGAWEQLRAFAGPPEAEYDAQRDRPDVAGTSRLSPHLHFGEIGPRQIWRNTSEAPYLRQLAWREFAHHVLHHAPESPEKPLRPAFERFPWRDDPAALKAWQEGRTGYPLVDAGMRELAATGWMHNRVRMVVATLLTKHLLTPWQEGARFFWDTLVDADLANNTLGWQWTAGCGADAAPYFRILNPVRQGERFDRRGDYVREWVPELMELPDKWIHHPWDAPKEILERAGVTLGNDYPEPIVDLKEGRERALAAYEHVKQARKK